MNTEDEGQCITTRLRVIYALERINRLLEEPRPAGHELPEETLELVASCVNALSQIVERRLVLDSQSPHCADAHWHSLVPVV
jgi:hypothetical protein